MKSKAPILVPIPTLVPISAPALAIEALSSHFSLRTKKNKRKTPSGGTSHKRRRGVGASSAGPSPSTPAKGPELWAPIFSVEELERQVTVADTTQEHNTCLALAQAVMLPRGVADLAVKDEVIVGSLTILQNMQVSIQALLIQCYLYVWTLSNFSFWTCVACPP